MALRTWTAFAIAVGLLAGCGGGGGSDHASTHTQNVSQEPTREQPQEPDDETTSDPTDGTSEPTDPAPDPESALNRYNLANRCFAIKSVALDRFVVRADSGGYQATAETAAQASGFYLKPSGLGDYLLYADDETLLAVKGNDPSGATTGLTGFKLTTIDAPANQPNWKVNHGVIWEIKQNGGGDFSLSSREHDPNNGLHKLAVNTDAGALTVADGKLEDNADQRFLFVPASQCADFPEIKTDTIGQTYKGNGVEEPVVGFADVHSHISATGFLGGAHVGRPFSQYGVALALPKGTKEHGYTGFYDLIGNIYGGNPLDLHDTQGWPTFKDWPAYDRLTYENTYYKWVKRSYKAGLRLVVNNLVQNDVLCSLNHILQTTDPGDPNLVQKLKNALSGVHGLTSIPNGLLNGIIEDALNGSLSELIGDSCNGMKTAIRQASFMYRMQDYIDAQNGGPDKGWFRIVTSPEQAREVINQGKLAVVLGIEISNVFDCKVTRVSGLAGLTLVDNPQCTKEMIESDLDQLYTLGVRQINLLHEFNNALGGNGIFNGSVINLGNFADTGEFWQTQACPTEEYFYSPDIGGGLLSIDPFSYLGNNPISYLLRGLTQGILPTYSSDPAQCNRRGITDLGRFAVRQVMDKHMMIDIDHMSVKMKGQVIKIAMDQEPMYPVISSHGGHGGITMEQARDILKTGGLINPIDVTPDGYVSRLQALKAITPSDQLLAMSYTSDINGMAAQPGPSETKIQYPFTLFQGADWGPKFNGIQPVTFEESTIPQGDRRFDYNKEGIAQYGLYADWVEAVRKKGGAEALNALYSSAEHYLRVWERARNR